MSLSLLDRLRRSRPQAADPEWDAAVSISPGPHPAWTWWVAAAIRAHRDHPLPVIGADDPDEVGSEEEPGLAAMVGRLPHDHLDTILVALERLQDGGPWDDGLLELEAWSLGFDVGPRRRDPGRESITPPARCLIDRWRRTGLTLAELSTALDARLPAVRMRPW